MAEREKLNIRSGAEDPRARILSNLADTPFRIGKYLFPAVESPLQGIKFAELARREEVFAMSGIDALKVGREVTLSIQPGEERFVYWGEEVIPYNSIEHRLLVTMFIHEKIRQNQEVQEALLATRGTFIYHNAGQESLNTSLPEKFFMEIYLAERKLLEMLNKLSLHTGGRDLSTIPKVSINELWEQRRNNCVGDKDEHG